MDEQQVRRIVREEFQKLMAARDQEEAEAIANQEYYQSLTQERSRKRREAERAAAEEETRRLQWRIEDLETRR